MFWITAALFVVSLGYGVVGPLVPALAERAHDTDVASFSWMFATYSAAKIAGQPIGGVVVDRTGPRRVLLGGLALYAVAMAGLVAPVSLAGIAALRGLEGAGEGLVYPAVLAAVREQTPDEHVGRRFGLVLAVGSSGLLLGPVLGAALRAGGVERPIAIAAGAAAIVALGGAVAFRPRAGGATRERRTLAREIAATARALRDPEIATAALPIAHNKLAVSGFLALFPISVVSDLGAPADRVAVLFLVVGLAFGLSQPLGGWLVDRFRPRVVVALALAPVLGSCAALALARSLVPFAAVLAVNVVLQSIVLTGVLKEVAVAKGARDVYGGVIGSMATATDVLTVAGPVLVLTTYPSLRAGVFPLLAVVGILFDVPYVMHVLRSPKGRK